MDLLRSIITPPTSFFESRLGAAMERAKNLILLDPHPDATGIDHDFQSPTFTETIEKIMKDYLKHNGEYLPNTPDTKS